MPYEAVADVITVPLPVFGSDTVVTVSARSPEGGVVPVTVAAAGPTGSEKSSWSGTITWSMPGVWWIVPHVTGTGASRAPGPWPVAVTPAPGVGERHAYATSRQYADVTREAPPLDVDRRLADASAEVDRMLHFAVYPVDDDGLPTDPAHIDALMLATVEVVRWWDANGWDGSGAEGSVQSASIAGVSLGFASGKQGGKVDVVGDKARQVLAAAGLVGGSASAPVTF